MILLAQWMPNCEQLMIYKYKLKLRPEVTRVYGPPWNTFPPHYRETIVLESMSKGGVGQPPTHPLLWVPTKREANPRQGRASYRLHTHTRERWKVLLLPIWLNYKHCYFNECIDYFPAWKSVCGFYYELVLHTTTY